MFCGTGYTRDLLEQHFTAQRDTKCPFTLPQWQITKQPERIGRNQLFFFRWPFALQSCITNESGQKAESEQQKICLNRASSVMVLMRSRGSTSVQFDLPASGHGVASSATLGHLDPELLRWTNAPKSSFQQPPGQMTNAGQIQAFLHIKNSPHSYIMWLTWYIQFASLKQ